MTSSLIYIPIQKPDANYRVLCFPYAGGNASTYAAWKNQLHDEAELALIQMPGRGMRFSNPPYEKMDDLVKDIVLALEKLPRKKLIFLGHSMGARVAYEVVLTLYRYKLIPPIHFIASGSQAPFIEWKKTKTYNLPDSEFIEKVRDMKGSPEEILQNNELMDLILPTLRADFKIIETYASKNKQMIPIEISVFAGKDDAIDVGDIEGWFKLFKKKSAIYWFNGGHFFIDNNEQIIKTVNSIIDTIPKNCRLL